MGAKLFLTSLLVFFGEYQMAVGMVFTMALMAAVLVINPYIRHNDGAREGGAQFRF